MIRYIRTTLAILCLNLALWLAPNHTVEKTLQGKEE